MSLLSVTALITMKKIPQFTVCGRFKTRDLQLIRSCRIKLKDNFRKLMVAIIIPIILLVSIVAVRNSNQTSTKTKYYEIVQLFLSKTRFRNTA